MSTLTGAPAAFALALGFQDATNGTAAPITPTPPKTDVEANKNFRLLSLTTSVLIS